MSLSGWVCIWICRLLKPEGQERSIVPAGRFLRSAMPEDGTLFPFAKALAAVYPWNVFEIPFPTPEIIHESH